MSGRNKQKQSWAKRIVSVSLGEEDIEYVRRVANHLGGPSFSDTLRYIIKERKMMHEEPWMVLPRPDIYRKMIRGGGERGKKT